MSLAAAARERNLRAVVFTGVRPGAGTTTTVIHVAMQLRDSFGLRPLVVELGGLRPVLARRFRLEAARSVEAVAAGTLAAECVQTTTGGLAVIPASSAKRKGRRAIDVAAVLRRILADVGGDYDLVLIDAPSMRDSADAVIAASVVPHIVLVVRAGRARHEIIERIRRELAARRIEVVGAVLNRHRRFIPGWLYRIIAP
jgi:Mrp family chromosome partitioning ATPase